MSNIDVLIHKPSEQGKETVFIGGLFPTKHVSIIASKAGAGKTWLILKLLTDLSNGGEILLGASRNEPCRHGLLLVGESGLELVRERLNKMADCPNDRFFSIISRTEAAKSGLKLDLSIGGDNPDGVRGLHYILKEIHPDIVILDTLMSFRSDDENSMQNTNTMLLNLQALAEEFECAIVATHHIRKRQNGAKERIDQDEIIGSSALVRQVAVAYMLTRRGAIHVLTPVKTWWKSKDDIQYRLKDDDFGLVHFVEPPMNAENVNMTERRLHIKEYLQSLDDDETITTGDIAKRFNCTRETARKFLETYCELVSEGKDGRSATYKKKTLN